LSKDIKNKIKEIIMKLGTAIGILLVLVVFIASVTLKEGWGTRLLQSNQKTEVLHEKAK
jgi:hypothetical protein